MKIIDRNLENITFSAGQVRTVHWIECYLHEDSLAEKRYTVVERHDKANTGFVMHQFDDEAQARECYAQAAVRVKESIRLALSQL